ncbi:MAG TPA: hypothetical protein VIK53_15975 [Verrucomicrobiae bacterium]
MKTKALLLGAVVTAFALTSFAAEPLLSPRAKDNQIKIVTSSIDTQGGTVTYVTSVPPALLSPRAQASQIKVVKGTNNDINAAAVCQKTMTGSPKAVAECSSHTTMPGCVTVAPLK